MVVVVEVPIILAGSAQPAVVARELHTWTHTIKRSIKRGRTNKESFVSLARLKSGKQCPITSDSLEHQLPKPGRE